MPKIRPTKTKTTEPDKPRPMMGPPPRIRMAVQELLKDRHRGMSAAQIAEALGLKRESIDGMLNECRDRYGTEFFRISSYRRQRGTGGREIPLYKNGPGADVARPKFGSKAANETKRRWAEKNRDLINFRNRLRRRKVKPIGMFDQLMKG